MLGSEGSSYGEPRMGKGSPAWNDPLEGSRRGRERIALEEAVAAAALAATLTCTIAG